MSQTKCCPVCHTKFQFPIVRFGMVPADSSPWITEHTLYCSVCSVYVPERALVVAEDNT